MIETTRHILELPDLPAPLNGIRIVQLTDFHRSRFTADKLLRHAVAQTNALCPDIVLLTGDYVTDDVADIEPCLEILSGLRARLGIFAILGNHDYYTDAKAVERGLSRHGFHVLLNRSVELDCGLWIVGLDDDRYYRTNITRAFDGIEENASALVLAHNPALVEKLEHLKCVVFSGHTHGGQIRLPFLTAREIRRIGAKHYRAGWYACGAARLYVNRGLGRVGIPLRLFCRPEIAMFTLTAGDQSAR